VRFPSDFCPKSRKVWVGCFLAAAAAAVALAKVVEEEEEEGRFFAFLPLPRQPVRLPKTEEEEEEPRGRERGDEDEARVGGWSQGQPAQARTLPHDASPRLLQLSPWLPCVV